MIETDGVMRGFILEWWSRCGCGLNLVGILMNRIFVLCAIAYSLVGAASALSQPAAELAVHRDIAYARPDGFDQRLTSLDIYSPAGDAKKRVMIWIHGGGWRLGDKARTGAKSTILADHQFLLASINYRLFPEVDFKQQAADVAKAIRWVHDHAGRYGGSADEICLLGHSAGAHLAALVATDEKYLQQEGLGLDVIQGVVLLDGAGYDIPRRIERLGRRKNRNLFTMVFGSDPDRHQEASPITHVDKEKNIPPFLILYVASRRESRLQSERFAMALTDAGVSARVVPTEGKTHATINREFGLAGDKPTEAAMEFLARIFH